MCPVSMYTADCRGRAMFTGPTSVLTNMEVLLGWCDVTGNLSHQKHTC